MPPYINAHCHLNTPYPVTGEVQIASIAYGEETFDPGTAPVGRFFSVGVHPWHLEGTKSHKWEDRFIETLSDSKVIAVGECGLDRLCENSMELQLKHFETMASIARDENLPMVLHIVKAWEELFTCCKRLGTLPLIVIHGFRGKPDLARTLFKKGFFLSMGVHFHEVSLQDAFIQGRLLLETDMATVPIQALYGKVAKALGIHENLLKKEVYRNASTIIQGLPRSVIIS